MFRWFEPTTVHSFPFSSPAMKIHLLFRRIFFDSRLYYQISMKTKQKTTCCFLSVWNQSESKQGTGALAKKKRKKRIHLSLSQRSPIAFTHKIERENPSVLYHEWPRIWYLWLWHSETYFPKIYCNFLTRPSLAEPRSSNR